MKAPSPMEVRPSGRVMAVREEQPLKAQPLMEVRLSGRVTAVREEHPKKAPSPRPFGPPPPMAKIVFSNVSEYYFELFRKSYGLEPIGFVDHAQAWCVVPLPPTSSPKTARRRSTG